jgi:hypothetical protein
MPLDYSPQGRTRWFDHKWFRRALWGAMVLCLAPIVVAGLCFAWVAAERAWTAARNKALLNPAMTYAAAPEQVVFDMDGGAVGVSVAAPPWVRWFPPFSAYPTVFVHERHDRAPVRRPGGELVAVQLETQLRNTYDGRTITDRPLLCFEPYQVASRGSPGNVSQTSGSTKLVILPQPADRVRVFAGQADASDTEAFTFDIEYNGVRQTVRGRLHGGVVTMAPEAGTVLSPDDWRYTTFWLPAGSTAAQRDATTTVANSAGQPPPANWPVTPFGKPFAAPGGGAATRSVSR